MPTPDFINAHELSQAFAAVQNGEAGLPDLKTLAHYDVDPLEDDAEERILEIINDEASAAHAIQRRAA